MRQSSQALSGPVRSHTVLSGLAWSLSAVTVMFRPVLLVALAAVVAVSRSSPVYQKSYFNLKPVLSGWGLPSLYSPQYSLRGLERYLHQAKVSPKLFVKRIKQYKPVIKNILSKQVGT